MFTPAPTVSIKFIHNEIKEDNELNIKKSSNELKIEIYPENKRKKDLIKEPLTKLIYKNTHKYSFDPKRELAYINSNVPLLEGFYYAHVNHLPIRIRPDDIWLLIIQAFSNHVNINSAKLRHLFVNFEGKQKLEVKYIYDDPNIDFKHLPKYV
jgi:hypothetical protein